MVFIKEISIRKVNFQCNFRENDLFREILIEKVHFQCEYDRILIQKENKSAENAKFRFFLQVSRRKMTKKRPFFIQKGFYNEISIRKVNFQCNFRENDLFREILREKVHF